MPLRNRTNVLRRKILRLYGATLIILAISFGFSLHESWLRIRDRTLVEVIRDAGTVSTVIQSTLLDASKILATVKLQLEKELREGNLNPQQSHKILLPAIKEIGIYNTPDPFDLLLQIDKEGNLIARSGEYPIKSIDLSDRFYFTDLKQNPGKKFSLGNLVTSRATGKRVFHFSMPIHDAQEKFSGVVVQQIDEQDPSESLKRILIRSDCRIIVQMDNKEVSFSFPLPDNPSLLQAPINAQILQRIMKQNNEYGWFLLPSDATAQKVGTGEDSPGSYYVGYACDPLFHLYTSARISQASVFSIFLRQSRNIFGGAALLSLLTISGLFYSLYRQSLHLEQAMMDSSMDYITTIANRRALERKFKMLWDDAARREKRISVLFMDIDHFKKFNDVYGHETGDEVLKKTALCIDWSLLRPLDFCCRWGGEEFLAVLHDTDTKEALIIAERIKDCISKIKLKKEGQTVISITLSIGIATEMITPSKDPDTLIDCADQAMRQAKAEGRNRVVVYHTA